MRRLLWGAAMAGAAYWASRQPGGIQGTWKRLQKGAKDIWHGEDPKRVTQRFLSGQEEMQPEYHEERRELAGGMGSPTEPQPYPR